ncbi:enoyl-CoA hydratase/isomerase family protein [Frankia gtarii]|uniref:enoyl-CoA hydratase/isomerase family protein n=1 Tax=Frankia gtarii TaxID=2950102 RepID=UPI0027DF5021|nr:enoyl-CoA hydratase/isomerase family protein [Frankia gtarii]
MRWPVTETRRFAIPDYKTLGYEERDQVAWVTLNRPEVYNAFDATMMREIHACWRSLRGNDDVHAVVLTAAGDKAFCTGIDRDAARVGDLDPEFGIGRRGKTPLHNDDPGDWLPPKTAGDLWKPVIGAVNGMACGGAFYLLAECDFLLAADHATFFDPHVTFGMAAVFESIMMSRRMPLGEVLRMALVGNDERISARRALEIGLVQEVVPAGELADVAHRVAAGIAAKPPLAVQATVRAIWYAADLGYRQALDVGKTMIEVGTDDESLAAGQAVFAAGKRPPWRLR